MAIAFESLLFLLAGILLAVVLAQVFGWKRRPDQPEGAARVPSIKLVRAPRTAQGREELLLTINDRVILAANSDGLRPADYADQVERLEGVATRIAAALGVPVEFARVGPKKPDDETGLPVNELPHVADDELEQLEGRLESRGTGKDQDTT